MVMTHLTLLLIKPSEPTIGNNKQIFDNQHIHLPQEISHINLYLLLSTSFIVEMFVLIFIIFIVIFLNQNDITNAKTSYCIMNNNPYLCQSIEMIYDSNSCVTRIEILPSLPDSGSGIVHERTRQIMDTQTKSMDRVCYVTNSTFIHWYYCSNDDYSDFAFYGADICYFYSITQISIGNAITTFSYYHVTTSVIADRVLKEKINKLYFIALISAVFGIIFLNKHHLYLMQINKIMMEINLSIMLQQLVQFQQVLILHQNKTWENITKNYVVLRCPITVFVFDLHLY